MAEVEIHVQQTPNPNSLLFHVDRTVTDKRMQQFNAGDDADDPLARALLQIDGVTSVFFMPSSITVSKESDGDWDAIAAAAEEAIRGHFEARGED